MKSIYLDSDISTNRLKLFNFGCLQIIANFADADRTAEARSRAYVGGAATTDIINIVRFSRFFYIPAEPENPYATAIPNIWEHIYLNQSF